MLSGSLRRTLIERHIAWLHKARWAMRASELRTLIQAERAKSHPDSRRLADLLNQQQDWQRQRHNVDLTRHALLDPHD